MNKIKSTILIAICTLTASASAQELTSGFFNDNYLYRHDLNPAFANEKDYFSVPLVGNLGLDMRGNIGLKDVLYKVDGRTALFLNPAVSSAEFDKNMKDNAKFTQNLKLQVLSAGFKGFGGYNTLELNVRENANLCLPGKMLKAMKDGLTNTTYDFSNLGASAQLYGELALGHSHKVNENLRIGAKVKVLLGVANIDMNVNKATLDLGEDNYTAVVDADLNVNVKSLTYSHSKNKNTGHVYVDGDIEDGKLGLSGFGLAADLGAEYIMGDWDFSLALQDLGFVHYGNNFKASTNGERTFNTDKYTFNVDDDATNSFDNEMDLLKNDLSSLYELDDLGNTGGRNKGLGATLNLGVKYTLPSYNRLSIGLTNTTRMYGKYSWTEFRLGANIRPLDFLAFSANLSAGTYGVGLGWMFDLQAPKGIDFFVGMDYIPGKLAKQGIPLSSKAQFSFGVNIPL